MNSLEAIALIVGVWAIAALGVAVGWWLRGQRRIDEAEPRRQSPWDQPNPRGGLR